MTIDSKYMKYSLRMINNRITTRDHNGVVINKKELAKYREFLEKNGMNAVSDVIGSHGAETVDDIH